MLKILLIGSLLFCFSCEKGSFSDRNFNDLEYYDRKIDDGDFEEISYYLEKVNKSEFEDAYQDSIFLKFHDKFTTAVLNEVHSIDEFEHPELLELKEHYFQMYLRSRK